MDHEPDFEEYSNFCASTPPAQAGGAPTDSEKLQMVRDVVTTWNNCAWVTDRDALISILSIVGDNHQP